MQLQSLSVIHLEYWIHECYLNLISAVLKNKPKEVSMFWLDLLLSVFLVIHVEIKLASIEASENRSMKLEWVVHELMELIMSSFILELV